jgi:hypothetical protein
VAALIDSSPAGTWAEEIVAGAPLYAPELVSVEVTNILRGLERAKQITTAAANAACVRRFLHSPPEFARQIR